MNISLTDVELEMLDRALGAVWWGQNATSAPGQSEGDLFVRALQRKLVRAMDHPGTEIE